MGKVIDPVEFNRRWPYPLVLTHMNPIEVAARALPDHKSWWHRGIYAFVSERWGEILMPAGEITDLASIPKGIGLIDSQLDDDSPIMGPSSQPHDFGWRPIIIDGQVTRGWLDPISVPRPRRATLQQVNELIVEAMRSLGASGIQCGLVYAAVQAHGSSIAHQFARL